MPDFPDLEPLAPDVDDAASLEHFGTRRRRARCRRRTGWVAGGAGVVLAAIVAVAVWPSGGDSAEEVAVDPRPGEPPPEIDAAAKGVCPASVGFPFVGGRLVAAYAGVADGSGGWSEMGPESGTDLEAGTDVVWCWYENVGLEESPGRVVDVLAVHADGEMVSASAHSLAAPIRPPVPEPVGPAPGEIPAGWNTDVPNLPPEVGLLATTGPAPAPVNQDRCPGIMSAAVGAAGPDVVVASVLRIDGALGLPDRTAETEQLQPVDVTERDAFGCLAPGTLTESTRFLDDGQPVMLSLIAGPDASPDRIAEGRAILLAHEVVAPATGLPTFPDEQWRVLSPAPIEARNRAVSAWTGTEVLVWGGGTAHATSQVTADPTGYQGRPGYYMPLAESEAFDGAAYNPTTDTWRSMAPAPRMFDSTGGAVDVWAETEWLLFGDNATTGIAYDPASDRWRVLAPAPVPDGYCCWVPEVVWTGDRAVLVGGGDHGKDVPMLALAYDPATDGWEVLPDAPITGRQWHALEWTGTEVLVWGGDDWGSAAGNGVTRDQGAAYDPAARSWRVIAAVDVGFPSVREAALWTGTEMVIPARPTLVFDPVADSWSDMDQPIGGSGQFGRVELLDGRLLFWADSMPVVVEVDGSEAEPLPESLIGDRCHAVGEWTGTEFVVWGGSECSDGPPIAEGLAFAP